MKGYQMEKLRVLLADDHAIIRDGLKQILADTADLAVCGEAANGNEALQLVREQEWDVIVLDISMPGRSGLDLIRLLRDEKPKLPILILSMHHEEQYAVRALHAGASGYLTKESDADLLLQAVRRVARGGVYVSDNVAQLIARGVMPAASELPHTTLSDREYQIFHRLVLGQGLTDIAKELSLSVKTISTHKTRILQKMSMTNISELIRYAVAHHLVTSTDV
jgi:DNA-binding NarL/FixJ family response regulator